MAANRYSVVFFGAILVAAGATYAVYRTVRQTEASSRIETAPVVVASRDMPEGTTIDRLALAVAQWPATTVPPGTSRLRLTFSAAHTPEQVAALVAAVRPLLTG